ncbi:MFS transporter [Nonomuraea rubra]|uniref:MFS family permease n=1 Tax=Nonomuraea rubra TaxID=46180 RepID=A0A7X0P7B9_9ACTN|nr:MFS transporter [Nonomuraea rubra]MBB6556384.1 MFS family permease [Nonomuraea rubra]
MITALDFTIVYVALPEIGRELGFSSADLQWVVSAYAVPFGGFLLLGGRLSDLLGRRRMFVLGMLLYGVASLLGGLAGAAGLLVGARALQGVGGAVLMPATLSLVVTMFEEGRARNRAMTVWAVCGASGMSVGALLGGVLTGTFGWEAVFFVNVPLAVVGVVGAFWVLAPDGVGRVGVLAGDVPGSDGVRQAGVSAVDGVRQAGVSAAGGARQAGVSAMDGAGRLGGFDLPGALTGTAGVTGLVFAISRGAEWGWGSAGVLVPLVVAVGLLVAFVVIEARSRSPLMPLRLLANRHTSAAVGAILVYGMTLQCVPYFLTLYFQGVLGYDAMQSGLAFLGPTLGIALGNLVGERLIPRLGLRGTLLLSVLVGVAGTGVLAFSLSVDGTYLGLLVGAVGFGVGSGLSFTTMFILASTGVAAHEQGAVSGLSSTVLQAGSGVGLAVLVSVAGREGEGLAGEALRVAMVEGLRGAFFAAAGIAVVGVVAGLVIPRRAPAPR